MGECVSQDYARLYARHSVPSSGRGGSISLSHLPSSTTYIITGGCVLLFCCALSLSLPRTDALWDRVRATFFALAKFLITLPLFCAYCMALTLCVALTVLQVSHFCCNNWAGAVPRPVHTFLPPVPLEISNCNFYLLTRMACADKTNLEMRILISDQCSLFAKQLPCAHSTLFRVNPLRKCLTSEPPR